MRIGVYKSCEPKYISTYVHSLATADREICSRIVSDKFSSFDTSQAQGRRAISCTTDVHSTNLQNNISPAVEWFPIFQENLGQPHTLAD